MANVKFSEIGIAYPHVTKQGKHAILVSLSTIVQAMAAHDLENIYIIKKTADSDSYFVGGIVPNKFVKNLEK